MTSTHAEGRPAYRSPHRKLVTFFARSRDKWKAKCKGAKAGLKKLKKRLVFLEERKEWWKRRAKALASELKVVKGENHELAAALAALKKNAATSSPVRAQAPAGFEERPWRHHFSLGHIHLFVSFVLSAAASLRCAGRAVELASSALQLPPASPSWYAGRLWLLRVGYYKLTRAKEQATDWVWIVDHTVQIGPLKCLVVLGLRLAHLPPPGTCLSHADVEPIVLEPVRESTGQIVYTQLEAAAKKTGIPRAIVSDGGSDLHAGIRQFCEHHPETAALYDIKHKTALELKHALEHDATWQAFTRFATETKQQLQQTPLAFLVAPTQRAKARYMNLETLVQWGSNVLRFLEQPAQERAVEVAQELLEEKLGALRRFRTSLEHWHECLQIVETVESSVRQNGLSRGCHRKLLQALGPLPHSAAALRLRKNLLAFVQDQSLQAQVHERLVGSSEIIESVFGKFKQLEHQQAKSGFTGLLLTIAAMVAQTTQEVIRTALQTVPTQRVLQWANDNLGPSVQAQRKKAFSTQKQTEQKWSPLQSAA